MGILNIAIKFAVDAHAGQFDKAGEPYILHPLRVMLAMKTDDERIVAVLHDVLEDNPHVLFNDLYDIGIPMPALTSLEALTKHKGEAYQDFIERCAADPVAKAVKLADLRDNSNIDRLCRLDLPTRIRLVEKYDPAIRRLESGYWPPRTPSE